MIALLAPFALGMALSAPGACASPAECGYYKPANPNVVFVDERHERSPRIGGNPATWTPQPPVIGGNPATWSRPGGYGGGSVYEQAAYAQQAYGQADYAQQSYGYAAPAAQGYADGGAYAGQAYGYEAQQSYQPAAYTQYAAQGYAYAQQQPAYGYGGYQACNTCQAPSPAPQPAPCQQACQPYIPQPEFQEIRIGDVYSGGVGITDVGGGGGGGGAGNFEVQGFGDISGFVSSRQQTWANATANANANSSSSSYANATNNVNIDVSAMFKNTNNYKGGGKMNHGGKGYTPPAPVDCNCDTGMTGGVGGGYGGHKSGGMMGGWGGKSGGGMHSGWGGGSSGGMGGCSTCGGSSGGYGKTGHGGKH